MACCQLELKGKVNGEVEVKSSSTALFHLFATRPHLFSTICPTLIQSCHVEHGEFGKEGSLIVWNYNFDGKLNVAKDILENVDVVNKSVTYRCVEGDLKTIYKTFVFHLRIQPQTNNCNDLAQWTIEYEKLNEDVDRPTAMLDIVLQVTKHADSHLLSNPCA